MRDIEVPPHRAYGEIREALERLAERVGRASDSELRQAIEGLARKVEGKEREPLRQAAETE